MIEIPALLSAEEVEVAVATLLDQPWVDRKVTAGKRSARAKNNRQLAEDAPVAIRLGGEQILSRLSDSALFMSAALPKKIYPPLFNRYSGGEASTGISTMRFAASRVCANGCAPTSPPPCSWPTRPATTAANW